MELGLIVFIILLVVAGVGMGKKRRRDQSRNVPNNNDIIEQVTIIQPIIRGNIDRK